MYIGSLSTGRSPSLLIPPKQYKSNLFFPRVSTPVAGMRSKFHPVLQFYIVKLFIYSFALTEAGPSSKPASTGLMKPPLSKQTPFEQKRSTLYLFFTKN